MDTATLLISESDRELIRARLLADRSVYLAAGEHAAPEALRAIDAALLRLDTPRYGYCRVCGVRIATQRLLELPATEHCLVCWGVGPGRHPGPVPEAQLAGPAGRT